MIITEYMENGSLDTFLKVGHKVVERKRVVGDRRCVEEYKNQEHDNRESRQK